MTKVELAKDWLKSLREGEPGEWNMEKSDMKLIEEALVLWLKSNAKEGKYVPTVTIDGVVYVPATGEK